MSRNANARLAGFAFLFYIAAGMAALALRSRPALAALLVPLTALCALVLGVTLYSLTRDVDRDIALLALGCRIVEAAPGEGTFFFAVGSTLFAWLLLRGRLVPLPLGWLGFVASLLLVAVLTVQQTGALGGPANWSSTATWVAWLPMLVYEVALGLWLIVRGVAAPAATRT